MKSAVDMRTYGAMLAEGRRRLTEAGVTDAANDAWLLLEHVSGFSRSAYFMRANDDVPTEQIEKYEELLSRRAERVPLQQILQEAWFFGEKFYVTADVLIPRQDTEILVEEAVRVLRNGNAEILDLCTGSGCVLLTVIKQTGAHGIGIDISPAALRVAEENQRRLQVFGCEWLQSDLFDALQEETFDVITANPPYIPTHDIEELEPEVREHDPMLALDGREDGLYFLQKIADGAKAFLKDDGWLLMEMGYDQGPAMQDYLEVCGYQDVKIIRDLAGLDRVIAGRKQSC